jgi:hypothetical protein
LLELSFSKFDGLLVAILEVAILAVPVSLRQAFEAQLVHRSVIDQQRCDLHKWFRFNRISATNKTRTRNSSQALPHLTKSCKAKDSLNSNGNKLAVPSRTIKEAKSPLDL